eukprot:1139334-Pelagomonas_calceolata.AAC.19
MCCPSISSDCRDPCCSSSAAAAAAAAHALVPFVPRPAAAPAPAATPQQSAQVLHQLLLLLLLALLPSFQGRITAGCCAAGLHLPGKLVPYPGVLLAPHLVLGLAYTKACCRGRGHQALLGWRPPGPALPFWLYFA